MKHALVSTIVLGLLFISSLHATPAQAQPRLVFVSGHGSDSNPCTDASPCRTFNQAYAVVAAGGEIDVLDPAGYGSLTIRKSISIQGHGVAGITPAAGPSEAIEIDAGQSDQVNLNGLIIDGVHFGATGIAFISGGSLVIENSVVRNWNSSGIAIAPTNPATINISNTLVADNGGHGIFIQPPLHSNDTVIATFYRVEVYNNAQKGIGKYTNLGGLIFATVVDSVAAHNGTNFYALGVSDCSRAISSFMRVFRSTSSQRTGSGTGILAEDHAQIAVGQSSLFSYSNGEIAGEWLVSTCGQVISFGDNDATGAAPNGTFSKF
jgi:hypothetical protein